MSMNNYEVVDEDGNPIDEDGNPVSESIEKPMEKSVESYNVTNKNLQKSVNNTLNNIANNVESYNLTNKNLQNSEKEKIELSSTIKNLSEELPQSNLVESEYSEELEPNSIKESVVNNEMNDSEMDDNVIDGISITDPLKTENIKIPHPERLINSNRVEQQTRKTNRFKLQEQEQQELTELIKAEGLEPVFNYGGKDHPDLTLMGNNEIQGKVNFVLCNRPDIHDKTKWYIHLYFFELSHSTIKKEIVYFFLKLTESTASIKKSYDNQLQNEFEKELQNELNELKSTESPESPNSFSSIESPESLISLRTPKKSKTHRYRPHKRSTYKRSTKHSTRGRKRHSKPFRGKFKYTYKRSKGPRKYKKRHTRKRHYRKRH